MQETYVRLLRRRPRRRAARSRRARGWRASPTTSSSARRGAARPPTARPTGSSPDDEVRSTEDTIVRRERDAEVFRALAAARTDDREAIVLAASGYRTREIADAAGPDGARDAGAALPGPRADAAIARGPRAGVTEAAGHGGEHAPSGSTQRRRRPGRVPVRRRTFGVTVRSQVGRSRQRGLPARSRRRARRGSPAASRRPCSRRSPGLAVEASRPAPRPPAGP